MTAGVKIVKEWNKKMYPNKVEVFEVLVELSSALPEPRTQHHENSEYLQTAK